VFVIERHVGKLGVRILPTCRKSRVITLSTGIWIADLVLDENIQDNIEPYADAGTLNANAGINKGVFDVGETAYANANVAKAQAGLGKRFFFRSFNSCSIWFK
jgi:hypothetical protein